VRVEEPQQQKVAVPGNESHDGHMPDHGSIAAVLHRMLLDDLVSGPEVGDAWIQLGPRILGRASEHPAVPARSQRQEPAG
jgi:hypothetical protein